MNYENMKSETSSLNVAIPLYSNVPKKRNSYTMNNFNRDLKEKKKKTNK